MTVPGHYDFVYIRWRLPGKGIYKVGWLEKVTKVGWMEINVHVVGWQGSS